MILRAGRESGSRIARMPTSQNRDMGHPANSAVVSASYLAIHAEHLKAFREMKFAEFPVHVMARDEFVAEQFPSMKVPLSVFVVKTQEREFCF